MFIVFSGLFFGLTKNGQGARWVYGAASGLATADGIRCSSCSQTWTRFQRGECFQFNYTPTAERRLKLALKGNSAPEFNVKQRENEWNSCFDGILNLFFSLQACGITLRGSRRYLPSSGSRVWQPQARGLLGARCSTISGQLASRTHRIRPAYDSPPWVEGADGTL